MRPQRIFSISCLMLALACSLPLFGQDIVKMKQTPMQRATLWNDIPFEVTVDEPGTLGALLDSAAKSTKVYWYNMRNLKVIGTLNGDDIKALETFDNQLHGNLFYRLDLSESDIVKGGDSIYVPEDNVIGNNRIPWPEKELILPNTLKKFIAHEISCNNLVIGDSLMYWPGCRPDLSLKVKLHINIQVSENNPYFSSLDGALFSKKGDKMFRYGSKDATRRKYTVPDGVREICYRAFTYAYTEWDEIVLPEGVISINDEAFSKAYGVTCSPYDSKTSKFVFCLDWLPSSLEYIGKRAFYYIACPIVLLPPNVKVIDADAFDVWSNVLCYTIFGPEKENYFADNVLYCTSPTPPVCIPNDINTGPFSFTVRNPGEPVYNNKRHRHSRLYVPTGSKAAYEQAFGWGYEYFKEIIEVDDVMAEAKKAIAELEDSIGDWKTDIQHVIPESGSTEVSETARYNLHGQRLQRPEKGWNIVRYSDGCTRKMYVK